MTPPDLSGERPARPPRTGSADAVVVTPPASARRRRDAVFVGIFLLAGLPVAAVLWPIVGLPVAAIYLVAQTAFLTYGLRRRHLPTLRLSADGLSYEPGRFQLRCAWQDVVGVEQVSLPTGTVESWRLGRSALHWAADPGVRAEVTAKGFDTVVPVADFEPDWRTGRIGDAARRWAPHLLGP